MTYHGSLMTLHRSSVNVFEKFIEKVAIRDYNFIRTSHLRHNYVEKTGVSGNCVICVKNDGSLMSCHLCVCEVDEKQHTY